jgi:hypothetical protein
MSAEADEKKTRVLHRGPAAGGRRAAPAGDEGEKIVFFCPNGHRIVVAADLAGKQGKCTKCRVPVIIPQPGVSADPGLSRPGPQPTGDEVSPAAGSVGPDPSVTLPATPAPPPEAAEIVAGPLAAPPLVAGEPGELEPLEPVADEAAAAGDWNFIGGQAEQPAGGGFDAGWPAAEVGGSGGENPTAILVARLWAEREHGGIIELHLDGGSVILPEWYDANWSRGTHGLFASQAADGSVTLTAVAWETVRKVVVRQLTEVPNDMFT